MVRFTLVVCLCIVIIAGCKKDGKKDCPSEAFEYHFSNNAKVDTLSVPPGSLSPFLLARKASGNKRVFYYSDFYSVCPEMIDGGSSQSVFFEIDPAATHFKFAGEDLQAAMCYYQYANILYSPGAYVPGGSIEGTKINDQKWQVSLNLMLKNNQALNKTAMFTVQ